METMSRALRQAARSPFSREIENAPMPSRFTRPPFNSYIGKTDPVEHVSHYIQMMSLHSHNDALMCKVFPSSLGPTALRWFNRLKKGSVHSFAELIQEFGVRFMTCSRVLQPVDSLLSMKMGAGETLHNYANRYWELYNEIGGGNEKIAASTFQMGLPEESGLRESLTLKPPEDMSYARNNGFNPRHRKDLRIQDLDPAVGGVNATFKEPAGHLKEFLVEAGNQETGQADRPRRNPLPPPLGVIEVIHAAPRAIKTPTVKGVLAVVSAERSTGKQPPGKKPRYSIQPIAFDDDDLECTTEPHHDALIVTARIRGFIVKRIMIDQGSGANVMYPDLYRGFGLKKRDLSKYDTPLMIFDGHVVIPEGQILLPVVMGGREVMVTFIVVTSFSPYTAIFGRPWIHDMGVVPSTLHVKVKFRTDEGITIIKGDQQAARQCLVAAAVKQTEQKESVEKAPL
ncbi:uncharacterized protein LOC142635669 [Castanea sativa]|uniref:uncharacterized protein LOC142635669 n=1 Tax=Castanea sativa TaxID=21020 RepID=UPI003F64FB4A